MKKANYDITNIIQRTFHIRTSFSNGTGLAIESNDQQFLVTAKHLVMSDRDNVQKGETIRLYTDLGQVVTPQIVDVVVGDGDPGQGGVDIAVLKFSQRFDFNGESPSTVKPEDLFVTQRVAMPTAENFVDFGVSFGITTRTGTIARIGRPENRGVAAGDFLIEIMAYPGFSGSPIICFDEDGNVAVSGIAARFSWRTIQVFGPGPVHTGFIGCFHIQHALDLIQDIV